MRKGPQWMRRRHPSSLWSFDRSQAHASAHSPPNGSRRDTEHVGDALQTETAEEPQLDDSSLSRIQFREFLEEIVEDEDADPRREGDGATERPSFSRCGRTPLPRFCARRASSWFTRIRRIIRTAAAQKCWRLFHADFR